MLFLAAIAACAATPQNGPVTYRIDPASSEITAKVAFFGIGSKTATFPEMEGSITIDPANPEDINLWVTLDAEALEATDGLTRRRLKGEKFFWVERHPEIVFSGAKLDLESGRAGVIDGAITARGQRLGAKLDVTFARDADRICGDRPVAFTASTTIDRRHYGMTSYGLIVGNTVSIKIEARMVPDQ